MKQKHTPGPWVVESVNSEALHDVCRGYDVPGAGSPLLIASVYDDDEDDGVTDRPGYISVFEAEANARLIAAAPDLLAACKAWDEGFVEGEQFTPERFRVWVNKRRRLAREAIAKATGEG